MTGSSLDLAVPSISAIPSKAPSSQPVRFLASNVSISVSSPTGASPPPTDRHTQTGTDAADPLKDNEMELHVQKKTAAPRTSERGVSTVAERPCHDPATLAKRLTRVTLRRLFTNWRWHAKHRHWKRLAHAKDEQIAFLLSKVDEAMARGIVYCRRAHGRRLLACWRAHVDYQRELRRAEADATARCAARVKLAVLRLWCATTHEAGVERRASRRAIKHRKTFILKALIRVWVMYTRNTAQKALETKRQRLSLTFAAWRYGSHLKARKADALRSVELRREKTILTIFQDWRNEAFRSNALKTIELRAADKGDRRLLSATFASWRSGMLDRAAHRLLEQSVFSLEIIRTLFHDNRRLAKLVDNGMAVTNQVAQLRAATDVNERLMRKLMALIERRNGSRAGTHHCPDLFRRLAAGEKRESPRQAPTPTATELATESDDDTGVCIHDEKYTFHVRNIGSLRIFSASETEFWALFKQVNQAFEEIGLKRQNLQ